MDMFDYEEYLDYQDYDYESRHGEAVDEYWDDDFVYTVYADGFVVRSVRQEVRMKIVNGNRVAENADEALEMFRKQLMKRKLMSKYRDDDGSTIFDKEEEKDYSSFTSNKNYYDYGLD